uniref:Microtubule associated scaffold protein 2 n=1 Tax=Leptobrachium leishanense TaxID=445787 RepID=A0A8C5WF07_9ANUR
MGGERWAHSPPPRCPGTPPHYHRGPLLHSRLRSQDQQPLQHLGLLWMKLPGVPGARMGQGCRKLPACSPCAKPQNEASLIKEKELVLLLATMRDEVAFNIAQCEKIQKEKEELEIKFDSEVRKLERQQREQLHVLKDRLQDQYSGEMERIRKEQSTQLSQLRSQHLEQIKDLGENHEAALMELKYNHSTTINSMHEDHERRVHELKESHEYDKKLLEDGFEKLRLSLQDQVDTLTFQNHSLKERAKRFEEALRKSTDEQLQIALAPYQYLEEDLKSVKEVLEMKNQLIHQQEKKIMELEKLAEINVILEEKIQVLKQQNEDLKARIDQNVVVTRQLSVENANLYESVEKESKEKKRLSRTNEELVWKLQTAESMSPVHMPSSPIKPSTSGPLSPAKICSTPR